MKTLVIYYSLSGHTQQVAEAIAIASSASVERIRDVRGFSRWLGGLRILFEIMSGRETEIESISTDPSQFDLVILGAPVWIGRLATPMRAYIHNNIESQKAPANGVNMKNIAFFCTEGAKGGASAFKAMADLCGQQPIATLEITESDIKSSAYIEKAKGFIDQINHGIEAIS